MLKGNAMVGQSGGPTTVINASLAGVIKGAFEASEIQTIYGAEHGITGVLDEKFVNLSERFADPAQLELLIHTPAAYLGSCRYKLPKEFNEVFEKVFQVFKKYNIAYFFYIGGNDSMDTVHKLSQYAKMTGYPINIIGVPKTIDNDLAITDHTPGFGSAAKYIASSIREVARDAQVYDSNTVTIIEIMGRNAGWLTAAAALARTDNEAAPHLIYLPEIAFDVDKFLADVEKVSKKYKNVIAVVSEGIKTKDGLYVCEGATANIVDSFGHKQLSGTARVLADLIHQKFGWKVRSIELSLLQRCAAHIASLTDVTEAEQIGTAGVKAAIRGETGMMMYFKRVSEKPYKVEILSHDISTIANVEKIVPNEWINKEGNDILQPALDYMLPLIQGESTAFFENGLPVYLKR
ncbi:MAG: Pyrophosphate--fructose 6-phosphate 1-phosphotransferase [Firmicutes bacterium ADurb.Bin193]|nr:MAG: Pyrophosphate--fructose 6-phosphate 1-phosphotransferase [Firmicutes bacterium ADurb.Bin193]